MIFLAFISSLALAHSTNENEVDDVQPIEIVSQGKSGKKPKKKGKKKKKKPISIPIEIGVGPAGFNFSGMMNEDQLFYSGVSLSGEAIISNKMLRKNKHMIPKQYRKMALAQEELRISKIWIPESILLSSGSTGPSAFGASFRPVSLSVVRAKKNKGLNVDLGARLTYAYINSEDTTIDNMHFLRVGLDGKAELRVPMGNKNSLGIGWASHAYIPPELIVSLGENNLDNLDMNNVHWHVGQVFVKYYYRFPYKVNL